MKAYSTEFFIQRAIDKYKDKYIYKKTKYINSDISVTITCKKHGDFILKPLKFLLGRECPKCLKKSKNTKKLTTDQFVEKSKKNTWR